MIKQAETVTGTVVLNEAGEVIRITRDNVGGLVSGLTAAIALMIIFRQRNPRWWFDFSRELARFGARVGAYAVLLTERYPSTVEEQSVHLEIDYPDAGTIKTATSHLPQVFLAGASATCIPICIYWIYPDTWTNALPCFMLVVERRWTP